MINVRQVIEKIPHFETFCSVAKLHGLIERLGADSRFRVDIAGMSARGFPIHHVRFGSGSFKALLVGFPQCMEPIGGLTVFSLMTLLHQGNQSLLEADVEWNIVPCLDPDGALLNEGWSQQKFTLENFVRNLYVQPIRDQVDNCFPVSHKRLIWNQVSKEVAVLKDLLDRIRPDFYLSLHNAWMGGAFCYLTRDIGEHHYKKLHELLEWQRFPLQRRPPWRELCSQFAAGVVEMFSIKKYYDYLGRSTATPEKLVKFGAGSWEYLEEIKPSALSAVVGMGYVRHPHDESEKDTGRNLRQFKLRLEAESKFLATLVLEEWEKVHEHLDAANPLYKAMVGYALPQRDRLLDGGVPIARHPTSDVLFNPQYNKTMTESDQFQACTADGGFFFLRLCYQFVRLLKESSRTLAVQRSIERLEPALDDALANIAHHIDPDAFEVFDCDTLARVQLGSGLILLNAAIEERGKSYGENVGCS